MYHPNVYLNQSTFPIVKTADQPLVFFRLVLNKYAKIRI